MVPSGTLMIREVSERYHLVPLLPYWYHDKGRGELELPSGNLVIVEVS